MGRDGDCSDLFGVIPTKTLGSRSQSSGSVFLSSKVLRQVSKTRVGDKECCLPYLSLFVRLTSISRHSFITLTHLLCTSCVDGGVPSCPITLSQRSFQITWADSVIRILYSLARAGQGLPESSLKTASPLPKMVPIDTAGQLDSFLGPELLSNVMLTVPLLGADRWWW
jgi:hypothetical protein